MLTTRTRIKVLSELAEENGVKESPVKVNNVEYKDPGEIETRRERRRKNITSELFETEKTYLHHLEMAQKYFEFPLRFNCLLSEKDHSMLFSNLEQILEVNKKLLEHMDQMTIGTAFKFLGPFLKLYSMYANNHGQASTLLQTNLQKNSKFSKFVHEQEVRPEVRGLKLGALLITPIQRIPRYKLLLEDLLENTCPDHHDYQHVKEAAKQVGEIALHINEHVRQHENFQKMLTIQQSFDNSAPKILAPGREFVKEGPLKKVSRRGGKAQERMFFLFSDMLLYGKPRLLDGGNNSYSCCCVLPLRHCQVEKVLGSMQRSDGGGMFRLSCKDESLLLYCLDAEEARSWIETLETAIRKLNNNRQTLRKPSSNKVPVRGKSIVKLRIKEKKQDLKRRLGRGRKKSSNSTQSKRELSPLKASLQDLSNCLTPSKRQRTESDSTEVVVEHAKEYEHKNEISLDNWSPVVQRLSYVEYDNNTPRSSGSHWSTGPQRMSYIDEEDENKASPALCAMQDFNYIEKIDEKDEVWTEHSTDNTPSTSKATCTNNRFTSTNSNRYNTPTPEADETSSQPWINPNFTTSDESANCVAGPLRKVTQMTSSIGGVMDNVRSGKHCSLM